ncbi:uncharacterized protein LOC142317673 [Lycorma delicatula]|uniref:uncharacterized protein LOC142317673 n=1 Tax=Lycorma delicatula TaxID=130591 RepID=UPI003F50EE8B
MDREDATNLLLQAWQEKWIAAVTGTWTKKLIPELGPWLGWKHGNVGYYLSQFLSGHRGFGIYLPRFKRRQLPNCMYCGQEDTPCHTFFECACWEDLKARYNIKEITPETTTKYMLRGKEEWLTIERFVAEIIRAKEVDYKKREELL